MRLLTSWANRPKKPSREEIAERIKLAVLQKHPSWEDMPERVFEPVYVLSECLVCGVPRYAHHGRAKRHLISKGGTG
jgi:hypothetical protein